MLAVRLVCNTEPSLPIGLNLLDGNSLVGTGICWTGFHSSFCAQVHIEPRAVAARTAGVVGKSCGDGNGQEYHCSFAVKSTQMLASQEASGHHERNANTLISNAA